MVKPTIDSYSRVYRDDRSYHYPTSLDNLMKEKTTEYFKGMELVIINIVTEKDPKMSLLDVTKNSIIRVI